MVLSMWSSDKLVKIISGTLVDVPSPSSLSFFWNFGSLLGVFLLVQIFTGLFLSFHFSGNVELSFDSVIHMVRDVNGGWMLRVLHANGASMFFLLMYMHIGRGIYFGSYLYKSTWFSGVSIFLFSMGVAFLGYVLPWGQMSFWAATVITNLLSAIPYVGIVLVEWVWGGFAVGNPTLIRFFAFHFVLPFVIMFMVMLHLFFLHETGSNNPMGLLGNYDKVVFHPYYSVSDIYGVFFFLGFYFLMCMGFPYIFMDVENFISCDPLVTPVHIQPEWYFLFAYSVLRSVPSSIGGVIALVMSVIILYFVPVFLVHRFRSSSLYIFVKYLFWIFVVNWLLLTWTGACIVELPYSVMGICFSLLYFFMYFYMWVVYEIQDLVLV
uniref:cytochrome b n=1 Tax=Plator insolens TaxID=2880587 RepID=UPI001F12B27A|nr:cytochrome b [Plator insolens]UMI39154.1 cytochrome b [Plator insolens]